MYIHTRYRAKIITIHISPRRVNMLTMLGILTLNGERAECRLLSKLVFGVALVFADVREGHVADDQVAIFFDRISVIEGRLSLKSSII